MLSQTRATHSRKMWTKVPALTKVAPTIVDAAVWQTEVSQGSEFYLEKPLILKLIYNRILILQRFVFLPTFISCWTLSEDNVLTLNCLSWGFLHLLFTYWDFFQVLGWVGNYCFNYRSLWGQLLWPEQHVTPPRWSCTSKGRPRVHPYRH